jgi:hypothetical protein
MIWIVITVLAVEAAGLIVTLALQRWGLHRYTHDERWQNRR